MNDASPRAHAASSKVPSGFVELALGEGNDFLGVVGPLYGKGTGADFALGFRVERRHCNPLGICHGGMLSTFADMALAIGANHVARIGRFLPTVNLTSDFLAPVPLGSWVEAQAQVLRATRATLFAQCLITADGSPAVRSSGIFKIGEPFAQSGSRGTSHEGTSAPSP
jgi:uncharacterized protein (TIGR00369 family)